MHKKTTPKTDLPHKTAPETKTHLIRQTTAESPPFQSLSTKHRPKNCCPRKLTVTSARVFQRAEGRAVLMVHTAIGRTRKSLPACFPPLSLYLFQSLNQGGDGFSTTSGAELNLGSIIFTPVFLGLRG